MHSASTCASGNHTWKGNIGILTEKAIKLKKHNKNSFSIEKKVFCKIKKLVL